MSRAIIAMCIFAFVGMAISSPVGTIARRSESTYEVVPDTIFCTTAVPGACPGNSFCTFYNTSTGYCVCDSGWTTVSTGGFCEYKRKSALTGLLLTIFLEALGPVGRLYADGGIHNLDCKSSQVTLAALFTDGFIGAFIAILVIGLLMSPCSSTEDTKFVGKIVGGLYTTLTVGWWIAGIVQFAQNTITDQNCVALQPI